MERGLAEPEAPGRHGIRRVRGDGTGDGRGAAVRRKRISLPGDAAGIRSQNPFRDYRAGRWPTVAAPNHVQRRDRTEAEAGDWAGCFPAGPHPQTPSVEPNMGELR